MSEIKEAQPIKTAPRDDDILLWFEPNESRRFLEGGGWIQGWWFSSPKQIDDGWETIIGCIGEPSHWLPLPQRPPEP